MLADGIRVLLGAALFPAKSNVNDLFHVSLGYVASFTLLEHLGERECARFIAFHFLRSVIGYG